MSDIPKDAAVAGAWASISHHLRLDNCSKQEGIPGMQEQYDTLRAHIEGLEGEAASSKRGQAVAIEQRNEARDGEVDFRAKLAQALEGWDEALEELARWGRYAESRRLDTMRLRRRWEEANRAKREEMK